MSKEPPVIAKIEGKAGRLTLNRPKALHALDQLMCEIMIHALVEWRDHDEVEFILVDHAEGTRGFCSGGDIRMLAESGRGDGSAAGGGGFPGGGPRRTAPGGGCLPTALVGAGLAAGSTICTGGGGGGRGRRRSEDRASAAGVQRPVRRRGKVR